MIERYRQLTKQQKIVVALVVTVFLMTIAGGLSALNTRYRLNEEKRQINFSQPSEDELKVIVRNIVYFLIKQNEDTSAIYANPRIVDISNKHYEELSSIKDKGEIVLKRDLIDIIDTKSAQDNSGWESQTAWRELLRLDNRPTEYKDYYLSAQDAYSQILNELREIWFRQHQCLKGETMRRHRSFANCDELQTQYQRLKDNYYVDNDVRRYTVEYNLFNSNYRHFKGSEHEDKICAILNNCQDPEEDASQSE